MKIPDWDTFLTRERTFSFISVQLLLIVWSDAQNLDTKCPDECHCVPLRMSCETPGLNRLPPPFDVKLEHLLVKNQTFVQTHLGPAELEIYRAPEFGGRIRLRSLSIRYCNIQTIGKSAFRELGSKLELLDLTGNPLIHVDDYAFADLGYLRLSLNEMKQPVFKENAFSGLAKMKTLFMQHSNLDSLPYEPLFMLTSTGKLDNLLVAGNRLRSLDEKYDAIFSKIENFNINDNPWHCDCELNWLIKRYQTLLIKKNKEYSSRSQYWENDEFHNAWGQEEEQPRCASPASLAGRNFSDLITNINDLYEFGDVPGGWYHKPSVIYCSSPKLDRIEIDLHKYNSFEVSNSSLKNSVSIKCAMRGSKKLNLFFAKRSTDHRMQYIKKSNVSYIKQDGVLSKSSWDGKSVDTQLLEAEVVVEPENDSDSYVCIGVDVIGNISTDVHIRWPKQENHATNHLSRTTTQSSNMDGYASVPRRWSVENVVSPYSVLHTPQYSLSQLLGAVAGTFVSTILLFFIVHRALHFHWTNCISTHKDQPKKSNGPLSQNSRVSPGGTSSSNTSSNTRLLSQPNPSEPYPNLITNQMNSESQSITANLLNARAYHQLMNGAAGLGFTTLPIDFNSTSPMSSQYIHPAEHMANLKNYQSEASGLSESYEPVSYSEANNTTYDIPWAINPCNTSQGHMFAEQNAPLLFSNPNSHFSRELLLNPNVVQSALMIPPPPTIPQPPTPQSTIVNGALNATPPSTTNLLVLQATYPNPHVRMINSSNFPSNPIPIASANHVQPGATSVPN